MTTPATTTALRYSIDLPFPISANRLWRSGLSVLHGRRGTQLAQVRVHVSAQYAAWIKEADSLYLTQKRALGPVRTLGPYTLHCVLSRAKRSPIADGDNTQKCIHDWLQRVEIIHNDCLCEGASWGWGEAPAGCRIMVGGTPYAPP